MNRSRAATLLLKDETILEAFDVARMELEQRLFSASTPEDREMRFQERAGLMRLRQLLEEWSSDLTLEEHYEH